MIDYYEILGVEPDASTEQITKGYRARAKRWHPDKWCEEPEADRNAADARFLQVKEAYDHLIDPEKRALFDGRRARQPSPAPQTAVPIGAAPMPSYAAEVARELREALENAASATTEKRRKYWKSKAESWERSLDPIISLLSKTVSPEKMQEMEQQAARRKTRLRLKKKRRKQRVVMVISTLVVIAVVVAVVLVSRARQSSPGSDDQVSATAQRPTHTLPNTHRFRDG